MGQYQIKVPHGIMFHHFHDERHPTGQGSISGKDFEDLLHFIGLENITTAQDWFENYGRPGFGNKVCITFDDSLKCQYDIAKPVMDKYGIKAFFFVYSSVLEGKSEYLEVFRYFRSKYFKNFDDFYEAFMAYLHQSPMADEVHKALSTFDPNQYLQNFSFYTVNDKKFRYLRDHILKVDRYNMVLLDMIKRAGVSLEGLNEILWMSAEQVKTLNKDGHFIGLHSHSHPTTMGLLPLEQQRAEYTTNNKYLRDHLHLPVVCMSHPCNSYNAGTLELLKDLNISMGFRANMQSGFESRLEIPREDHINVFKMMKA
ncbi:polysaccharide deacetylase family protein [Bdellovibrio sp. HCB337]|uniref:polysaccharide deacetylase family protein n=1 Tax=Bdellovibrio sp. HCB337 TaxID=3394358 RepID=UPI0039A48943